MMWLEKLTPLLPLSAACELWRRSPHIHKAGNQPGKLSISTLSDLWYNEKQKMK